MSDWRNGSNKDGGRKQNAGGRKAGRPIPTPSPSAVPDARSAAKANRASSQDWRGNAKKGTVAGKSQDRTWTGRGRETPSSTSGLRKAVLLSTLAIAISFLFYCFWVFIFKNDPRLPVIVSIAPDYVTHDLGQNSFRNHDFDFKQKFVHVLPESQNSTSSASRKLEPDERFLDEARKNDEWGASWSVLDPYLKGPALEGGGPSGRVTVYFVSSLIAREASPEVTGSDIAEDAKREEQWVLLTKGDDPFDPSTEKLLTVKLLLERIANRTASGSLALVVLDVRPPSVVTNLGDLEFPKFGLEDSFDSLSSEQKNKLCVCLPCDSGQESWHAPEFKSSVFAHFFWKGVSTGFDNSARKWTLGEFRESLQKQVSQWVARHRFAQQTPTFLMSDAIKGNEDKLLLVETTGGAAQSQSGENMKSLLTDRYRSLDGLWEDYALLRHCLYSNPLQYATVESGLVQMEDLAEMASEKAWKEFELRVKDHIAKLKERSKFDRRVSLMEAKLHGEFLKDSSTFSDVGDAKCLELWSRLEQVARSEEQSLWTKTFSKQSLQEELAKCSLGEKREPTEWLEVRLLKLMHEALPEEPENPKAAKSIAGLIKNYSDLAAIAYDPRMEVSSWNKNQVQQQDSLFLESFDLFTANLFEECSKKLDGMQTGLTALRRNSDSLKSAMTSRDEVLWLVPHMLASQMRLARHIQSDDESQLFADQLGPLLQDAIFVRDSLVDESAEIAGLDLKPGLKMTLDDLKRKLSDLFSAIPNKAETDAGTLPLSRIALRWPLLDNKLRSKLHNQISKLYEVKKDDVGSADTSFLKIKNTPSQVAEDFSKSLRLLGSNLESSGSIYTRLVKNDPRYSIPEIENDKSRFPGDAPPRQRIYRESYQARMVASAFGQRAITAQPHEELWPWNSPDQVQAVNEAYYNHLQSERLCTSRWGDGNLDALRAPKLYFERMLTLKGPSSRSKSFLESPQTALRDFRQTGSIAKDLEKATAEFFQRAVEEVNRLGTTGPIELSEENPVAVKLIPNDWKALATISIHNANSPDRIPFTDFGTSKPTCKGIPLNNDAKQGEATQRLKIDRDRAGMELRLGLRGNYKSSALREADPVNTFRVELESPKKPSTVRVTAQDAEPITLWVLLDCSGSMSEGKIFEKAKSTTIQLIEQTIQLNDNGETPIEVGFMAFGLLLNDQEIPDGLNKCAISNQIFKTDLRKGEEIGELITLVNSPSIKESRCTPLYDAIFTACEESKKDGQNWIVVISDGFNELDLFVPGRKDTSGNEIKDDGKNYTHSGGNKSWDAVRVKVLDSKSSLFVYQYWNEAYYAKTATNGRGDKIEKAKQELEKFLNSLPDNKSKTSKLFYSGFDELEKDLIALLPKSTIAITDSMGSRLGDEPFEAHTFGNPISIQVSKPTQATLTVNSRSKTSEFPIWLAGGEKLEFKYSDTDGLRTIPFKDDKNGFGNSPKRMVIENDAKSDLRIKATKAINNPYRLDIQLSMRGNAAETVEQTTFIKRPRFLVASVAPAEMPLSEAFWVGDHSFRPNTHYPLIQLPSIPWKQGNEWRSEELDVNVWLADEVPEKAKRVQLNAGAQSNALSPLSCVRVNDVVTVSVATASESNSNAERYFVLCNNELKAVRTYVDSIESKIEFSVPATQPAELVLVTLKDLEAWESEGALKHYKAEKLRFGN